MPTEPVPTTTRRLVPPEALLPLAVALVLGGAFAAVALDFRREGISAFDEGLTNWVREYDAPSTDAAMRFISDLGTVPTIAFVFAGTAFLAMRRGGRASAMVVLAVAIGAWVLNALLKLGFQRARPSLFFEIVAPTSYSFPSGHALSSTAAYGMALLVVARFVRNRVARILTAAVAPTLVLLVGLSRVYLGVHWPTDVVAGFAVGGLLLLSAGVSIGRIQRKRMAQAGIDGASRQVRPLSKDA